MKFLIGLFKFTIVMLIANYIFIGMGFNKAIIISIVTYSGPKLMDYTYIKIKNKLIKKK